jgi:hypothetical protein
MRISALAIATIGFIFISDISAAFLPIDNFSNPASPTIALIGPGPNPAVLAGTTPFGFNRTSTFTVNIPAQPNPLDLIVSQGGGAMDFNSGTFSQAQGVLRYTATSGPTMNFLVNGTPFRLLLSFANIDPGLNVQTNSTALDMPVDIAISTTAGTLSGSTTFVSSPAAVVHEIVLSNLTGFGDLSQVLNMDITFNSNLNGNQRQRVDFVLNGVQFETNVAPAPPAIFAALAGVPLLAIIRRRGIRKSL